MADPVDENRLYRVVCPACFSYLGQVYARHADHLARVHMPHCDATERQREQAIADVQLALKTGDTSDLDRRCLP